MRSVERVVRVEEVGWDFWNAKQKLRRVAWRIPHLFRLLHLSFNYRIITPAD